MFNKKNQMPQEKTLFVGEPFFVEGSRRENEIALALSLASLQKVLNKGNTARALFPKKAL